MTRAPYQLRTRPHIGCASPTIYEVIDVQTGAVVRSTITPPSVEDCLAAVRIARSVTEAPAKAAPARGEGATGRSRKRAEVEP